MAQFIVNLIGPRIFSTNTATVKPKVRKAEAVFYYCWLSPRPVSRLYLCDLLWPDVEEKKARQNLNDAFYSLRSALQEAHAPEAVVHGLQRSQEGLVELNRACDYTCDVEEFERIVASATEQTDLQSLERAFDLYRGPFLDNFVIQGAPDFDAWVEGKRQTLAGAYHKLLHLLSTHYLTQSRWSDAIKCLEYLRLQPDEAEENAEAQRVLEDQEIVHGVLMMCHALMSRLDLTTKVYEAYEGIRLTGSVSAAVSLTLQKLHKILQTCQLWNLRGKTLVAEALQRLNHRTMEPRLEDALLSMYMATGVQRAPRQGRIYHEVLRRAQESAVEHGATLIGTPHLALALCSLGDEACAVINGCLPFPLETLRRTLQTFLDREVPLGLKPTEHTLALHRALQVAEEVATITRAETVNGSHLWIGLLKQEQGVFVQLLTYCGADQSEILEQIEDALS